MNCKELRSRLDDYLDSRLDSAASRDVEAHLAACPGCSAQVRVERLLRVRLQELPAPPPPKGFARRVLSAANASRPRLERARPLPLYAAAAAALAFAFVAGGWFFARQSASGQQVVTVQGGSVQRVQLVFNSPSALTGVTLHVGLPQGVELAQYPGVHELTWQADLKAGPNLLALPVIVRGSGGTVLASVSFGTERKQFSVQVQAVSHDGASLHEPPGLAMGDHCPVAPAQDIIAHA